jgi:uncharacterized ferritin-like protein (DUF455 family)
MSANGASSGCWTTDPVTDLPKSITDAASVVLRTADPAAKAEASRRFAQAWNSGAISEIGAASPPDRPARPNRPALRPPGEMPRRRINTAPAGRIALLHALAHIELNAIDLAWDILARFAGQVEEARSFCRDWAGVAAEEAKHFTLLSERLASLGACYGDLPAHDGLWEAASATRDSLAARLAVVPLVLEARGLDVTPPMIGKLRQAGDDASADILEIIHDEEIGHVAVGRRWFDDCCRRAGQEPVDWFHALVRAHFKGSLKPPFNRESRNRAGLTAAYYEPLVRR